MVELRINGGLIDMEESGNDIKVVRQIADVFDLSVVSNSYTNSFSIPKTQNNTQRLSFLGMVGDNSPVPYSKNEANVKYFGFDVIVKGWMNISETTDDYKASIIDGMIDFFKDIEGKTIGTDLDLSNFTHEKTLENIIASYSNDYYSYPIADYNGKTQIKTGFFPNVFAINIDALVPAFSVKKLFELILSTYGYTYSSTELDSFLEGLWITYPTPPIYEESNDNIVAEIGKTTWVASPQKVGSKYIVPSQNYWSFATITEGSLIDNWKYVIGDTSGYRFNLKTQGYAQYTLMGLSVNNPLKVEIIKNGIPFAYIETNPTEEVELNVNVFCQTGDIIEVSFFVTNRNSGSFVLNKFHHLNSYFNVYKIDQGDVTPVNAFSNFKITDFFKEILYRTGLTPIPNNVNKQITFLSIAERLDRTLSEDWSDKYIGRVKETYVKNSYAQRNYFKMKYNNNGDIRNDGVIVINNENIEAVKTLVTSVFYSPTEGVSQIKDQVYPYGLTSVPILPMWSKDVSVNEDDEIEISYKPLDDRFYLLRRESKHSDDGWQLASEVVAGNETVYDLWFANTDRTLLGSLVAENYSEYSKIFQNFRSYDFELALGLEDILSLDLKRPYYFEQESAFFLINKITYQQGKKSIAEVVKINYI